jgi:hypothetical protein
MQEGRNEQSLYKARQSAGDDVRHLKRMFDHNVAARSDSA